MMAPPPGLLSTTMRMGLAGHLEFTALVAPADCAAALGTQLLTPKAAVVDKKWRRDAEELGMERF
jgi:hypothetical protein